MLQGNQVFHYSVKLLILFVETVILTASNTYPSKHPVLKSIYEERGN